MQDLPLGKETNYVFQYDSKLLARIPRSLGRDIIGINSSSLQFKGVDIWNCYEMCWLGENGLPEVRILKIYVDYSSSHIVESKSLKLYLNSFSNHKFKTDKEVSNIIQDDLSKLLNSEVKVSLHQLSEFNNQTISNFTSISIDQEQDVVITDYNINKELLSIESEEMVEEELCSDLLKSNCLVTNQPDWASAYIKYKGPKIDRKSLLKYIISYRNHSEFHEQCVEHMFTDIMEKCTPSELTIYAKYTRRGGIDINPFRTNVPYELSKIDQIRAVRQ